MAEVAEQSPSQEDQHPVAPEREAGVTQGGTQALTHESSQETAQEMPAASQEVSQEVSQEPASQPQVLTEEQEAKQPAQQAPEVLEAQEEKQDAPSPVKVTKQPEKQQKEKERVAFLPTAIPTTKARGMTARYSYAELKEAQRRCESKMVETALLECRDASRAQREIFRAHVTDLCANIFAAALRKYNPENREDFEPVDPVVAAKAAKLEKKLKAKEATVEKLRDEVPRLAAVATRLHLASERKRNADVLVTATEEDTDMDIADSEVEAMKEAYIKTSSSIANASARLSQVILQTSETIDVVEQAMKRPKTAIDRAMELSPLKPRTLLEDEDMEDVEDTHASTMRTRLAVQLTASKNM